MDVAVEKRGKQYVVQTDEQGWVLPDLDALTVKLTELNPEWVVLGGQQAMTLLQYVMLLLGHDRVVQYTGQEQFRTLWHAAGATYNAVAEPKEVNRELTTRKVYSDASTTGGYAWSGCAWVSSVGEVKTWVTGTRNSGSAELRAAMNAFGHYNRPVDVYTDSKQAVSRGRYYLNIDAYKNAQGKIRTLKTKYPRRILWVPGHAGDPLNELADRLAVLTRRNHQARVDGATHAERVLAVAREHFAERAVLV